MKKKLHFFTALLLLCVVSSLFAQKNVLFVSGSGPISTAAASDTLCIHYLTKSGYTVTHIDDNTSKTNVATDTIGKNIIIISSTVAAAQVNHVEYAWTTKPVVIWENAAEDEYGISMSGNCTDSAIVITSNTHPMLKGLPIGKVYLTYGDLALSYCSPVNPVNSFATFYDQVVNANRSAWGMWEIGDDLDPQYATKPGYPADGKAVGRRCKVPFQNNTFNKMTPEGLTLFLNSVDYLIDKTMDAIVPIVKLGFDTDTVKLNVDEKMVKKANVFPSNATGTVNYTSTDISVATYANGEISALKAGITLLIAEVGGKIDTLVVQVAGTIGISNISSANFEVYPNPVKDMLRVNAEDINSVTIYNEIGRQVLKFNKDTANGINVSGLKAGIYFIKISTGKGITTTKFIKE